MNARAIPLLVAALYLAANPQEFDVTDGKIEKTAGGRFQVRSSEMRATLKTQTPQKITVNFTLSGFTKNISKQADGTVRHQFGLKLRAQDSCNLIYVMWHFDKNNNGIAVSVKSNPGQATSGQCGDRGYINGISARVFAAAPVVRVDEPHRLTAGVDGLDLTVTADGTVVWQGRLPEVAGTFNGPVGFRSDNAHVVFDYKTGD